jgi:hypothetical protein
MFSLLALLQIGHADEINTIYDPAKSHAHFTCTATKVNRRKLSRWDSLSRIDCCSSNAPPPSRTASEGECEGSSSSSRRDFFKRCQSSSILIDSEKKSTSIGNGVCTSKKHPLHQHQQPSSIKSKRELFSKNCITPNLDTNPNRNVDARRLAMAKQKCPSFAIRASSPTEQTSRRSFVKKQTSLRLLHSVNEMQSLQNDTVDYNSSATPMSEKSDDSLKYDTDVVTTTTRCLLERQRNSTVAASRWNSSVDTLDSSSDHTPRRPGRTSSFDGLAQSDHARRKAPSELNAKRTKMTSSTANGNDHFISYPTSASTTTATRRLLLHKQDSVALLRSRQ